jgi:hypothetical protein
VSCVCECFWCYQDYPFNFNLLPRWLSLKKCHMSFLDPIQILLGTHENLILSFEREKIWKTKFDFKREKMSDRNCLCIFCCIDREIPPLKRRWNRIASTVVSPSCCCSPRVKKENVKSETKFTRSLTKKKRKNLKKIFKKIYKETLF